MPWLSAYILKHFVDTVIGFRSALNLVYFFVFCCFFFKFLEFEDNILFSLFESIDLYWNSQWQMRLQRWKRKVIQINISRTRNKIKTIKWIIDSTWSDFWSYFLSFYIWRTYIFFNWMKSFFCFSLFVTFL